MTCSENNFSAQRRDHPICHGLAGGKKTPRVIGVKENVPLVCHEVLCGTHSTSLTQLSVIQLLNHSHCHLLLLTLCTHALMPSFPFLTPSQSSASLCMATEGRSNDFPLLMRQGVSVLCSSVELQQIKRAFIGFEASAATPKCHRGI